MSLHKPTTNSRLTQRFGYTGFRANGPFVDNRTGKFYRSGFHTGLDLAATVGSPIYAPDYGTIYTASWEGQDPREGYGKWAYGGGNVIIIQHNTLPFYTSFAHLDRMHVKTGQDVYRGQLIGTVGATGNVTGPHTHYSTWFRGLWHTVNQAYVEDPLRFEAGGDLANDSRIKPTRIDVNAGVNVRVAPSLTSSVRTTTRSRTTAPYFRTVKGQKLTLYGITSDEWVKVWLSGWSYVWKPLTRGMTV